jgi:hypothetical protein
VVEWSKALDVRLREWCCSVSMGFKSRRGKNKNLTALKSNSNTVWFNFQTYIYIYIYSKMHRDPESLGNTKVELKGFLKHLEGFLVVLKICLINQRSIELNSRAL